MLFEDLYGAARLQLNRVLYLLHELEVTNRSVIKVLLCVRKVLFDRLDSQYDV